MSSSGDGASFCEHETLHVSTRPSREVKRPKLELERTHPSEQPDRLLGPLKLAVAHGVLCRLRVEEPVLAVEEARVLHGLGGALGVAGALEDARAQRVELGERGRVRQGERERAERGRVVAELRVVRGEEVEGPQVRRGRLERVVCVHRRSTQVSAKLTRVSRKQTKTQ